MDTDQTVKASRLDMNGRRVAVRRFGCVGGWPLVWNHAGLSCGRDAKVIDAAARRCGADIISIDRPGIGRSDGWSMSLIAKWPYTVAQVADLLQVGTFAVAGWSGGGPYALACAAAMPERVRAVATVAGIAPLETVRHVIELGLWADRLLIPTARWLPQVAAAFMWVAGRLPDRYLAWEVRHGGMGGRDGAALESAIASLVAAVRESTISGVSGMVDEYRRYYGSWGFDLDEVRQSVTIWQGEHDTWLPMKHARRLANALPNSTLRVVPLTGHVIPVVIADEFLDDLAP